MRTVHFKPSLLSLCLAVLLLYGGLTLSAPLGASVAETATLQGGEGDRLAVALPAADVEAANVRAAHLTFRLDYANNGLATVDALRVYVAIPANRDNQRITGLTFSEPYTLLTDRYGQQVASFRLESIAAGTERSISWQGDVEIEARDYGLDPERVLGLGQIPADIVATYTSPESMYRLDSPIIQAAAVQAAGGSNHPYWIAYNVHDFVAERLTYLNDHRWDNAETVYLQQHGSCTEYTWLYVALCRANGLPARYVGATMARAPGQYVDTTFHRWAEVYLPPYGWVPVDVQADDIDGQPPSHARFGSVGDSGFVTTVGGGASEYLGWEYHSAYGNGAEGEERVTVDAIPEMAGRSFTWEPYPPQLRVEPASLGRLAQPGEAAILLGNVAVISQNGPHSWWLASAPSWAHLEPSSGWTPNSVAVLADTTGLGLGLHSGQVVLDSSDNSASVSLELWVVEETVRLYLPLAVR